MDTFFRLLITAIFWFGAYIIFNMGATVARTRKVLDANPTQLARGEITKEGGELLVSHRTKTYVTHYSYQVGDAIFDDQYIGRLKREPNGSLAVRYLVADPSVHEVVGSYNKLGAQVIFTYVLALVFVVMGIVFLLFAEM